jgi:hypothetical protein
MRGRQEDSQNSHAGAKAQTIARHGGPAAAARICHPADRPTYSAYLSASALTPPASCRAKYLIVEHTARAGRFSCTRCANGCRLKKAYTIVLYNPSGR